MNIVFYYSFFPQERAAEQIVAALIALCEENGEYVVRPAAVK